MSKNILRSSLDFDAFSILFHTTKHFIGVNTNESIFDNT